MAHHTFAGAALSLGTFMISFQVWLWLLPVWLGLMLAIPLAYLTSLRDCGAATRQAKLFFVPSEANRFAAIVAELKTPGTSTDLTAERA